jgi:hypothetical protein
MSKDEVSQYHQLGKKTYKIALGNGNELGNELVLDIPEKIYTVNRKFGRTQINFIEQVLDSKNPENIIFQLVYPNGEVLFETASIEELKKIIRRKYSDRYYYDRKISIRYFDNSSSPIYHFRTISSVVSIIDLINYTKRSVLNFEISNGIDTITPQKLAKDIESVWWDAGKYVSRNAEGYVFTLISDNLTPIFNSRCNFSNHKLTNNGPNGIFGTYDYDANGNTCGKSPSFINLYEPFVKYNNRYGYNGGRNKSFDIVYNLKYSFLTVADQDIPDDSIGKNYGSRGGFQAVITLYDYKVDGKNVITFYYEDILSLSDIEKVQEYKVSPISKN